MTIGAVLVILVPVLFFDGSFETWLLRGLTLLVIACPCALVISTPVSVVSAVTSAARNGVLIKGGESLERMGEVRVMAFDKSGTLTHGRAEVVDVVPIEQLDPRTMLCPSPLPWKSARSTRSGGPSCGRLGDRGLSFVVPVDRVSALPGRGVEAVVDGVPYVIGRAVRYQDFLAPGPLRELEEQGRTAVLMARGLIGDHDLSADIVAAKGQEPRLVPLALLALDDSPRQEVRELFDDLRREGIDLLVVLSGDHETAVRRVGNEVGADRIHAGLNPGEKVDVVKQLESTHGPVAMVGDGINDAPALAAATVGIALGAAASDAALETADIAVMGDDLSRLPYLVRCWRGRAPSHPPEHRGGNSAEDRAGHRSPARRRVSDRRGTRRGHGCVPRGHGECPEAGASVAGVEVKPATRRRSN